MRIFRSMLFVFLAVLSLVFAAAPLHAEVITLEIKNSLGKNDKPVTTLRTTIEPLNEAALESGLSAEQIKATIKSSLVTKNFQLSESAGVVLSIKFVGLKNKSDFSGYLSLDITGEEKRTSSGNKYHQLMWSGSFLFPYDTDASALHEIAAIVETFVKNYLATR